MNIQTQYSAIYTALVIALIVCAVISLRSEKPIGRPLGLFLIAVSLPVLSNIIIICSHDEFLSTAGYYAYYISMTLTLIYLVNFANEYCKGIGKGKNGKHRNDVYYIFALGFIDIIQLLLGTLFHHVFKPEKTIVDGLVYYKSIPLGGLLAHRIINYILFLLVLAIMSFAALKTTRYYRAKFLVIVLTLIFGGITQAYFIFSRTPIDRSVLVHGIIGLLLFYFSILYRPLRLLDTILSSIVSDMNDSIFVFDQTESCIWANKQGFDLLEIPHGKTERIKDALIDRFGDMSGRGDEWNTEIFMPSIQTYYYLEKKSVKSKELVDGYYITIKDTTEQRSNFEKEVYDSTHDTLTGLYNEQYLYYHIKGLMRTGEKNYCAVWMNIKNFKIVNDVFGKRFGDLTLKELADWLKTRMEGIDGVYGRLVGDTFGAVLPTDAFDPHLMSEQLENFVVRDGKVSHQICIHTGVYNIYDRKMEPSVMFDRAHLALSNVTDNYKNCIRFYDDTMRNAILEEQSLVAGLPDALKNNQIRPYLQPITDATGNVVGAEALARWLHPKYGFLQPSRFIPLFEKNGMIVDIDKHIWRHACEILRSWKGFHDDLFISINISPKDFYFIDVAKELKKLTEEFEIEPVKLRIEITETVMITDSEDRIKTLDDLRSNGFIVEMDDFGSGYSSLNMLKNIPVDVIKIDMNFLSGKNTDRSETIIRNMINLSNELNITTLTEGVETALQYNKLIDMGCSLFQGYYFAKPMPDEEFETYIIKE